MAGNVVIPDPAAKVDPETTERIKDVSRRFELQSFKEKYKGRTSAAVVTKLIEEFDANRDGSIDKHEFAHIIDNLVEERAKRQQLKYVIIVMAVFGMVLIGALSGMTWAVVASFSKTDVSSESGTMYVKGSNTVVQTMNSEMSVIDGVLIARQAQSSDLPASVTTTTTAVAADGTNGTASTEASPSNVLRAASYMGPPQRFSSRLPVRVLMELKYFYIQGPGDTELALVVQGVARVPDAGSVWGTVVRIVTAAGTITLDDTAISFREDIAPIFEEAGFSVAANRRSLLGIYEILGFFNFIADMTVFNLPTSEPKPRLTTENFMMRIKIYEPCVLPANPDIDRCQYTPSTPMEQVSSRRRELRTIPYQRALQETDTVASEDLAGTELLDGQRYMTHYETSWLWKGVSRTEYEYALFPAYRKVELVNPKTRTVDVWQERTGIPAEDEAAALVNATYFFCNRFPSDNVTSSSFTGANSSMSNFTFVGFEEYAGRLARHFRLWVPQPVNQSTGGDPDMPAVLEVDYWDSRQDNAPLGFEFTHPLTGKLLMRIEAFKALTSADVNASAFIGRARSPLCSNDTLIPQLSSPVAVPTYGLGELNLTNATADSISRRRLTSDAYTDEAVPSSALVEHMDGNMANRRELISMTTGDAIACGGYGSTKVFDAKSSALQCNVALYKVGYWRNKWHAEASCNNIPVPDFPFLSLYGSLLINTCSPRCTGCVGARFGLAPLFDKYTALKPLKNYLNKANLEANLCADYNRFTEKGFASGTVALKLGPAVGSITANLYFDSCRIWMSSASIQGSIIINAVVAKVPVSTGNIEFIKDKTFLSMC